MEVFLFLIKGIILYIKEHMSCIQPHRALHSHVHSLYHNTHTLLVSRARYAVIDFRGCYVFMNNLSEATLTVL